MINSNGFVALSDRVFSYEDGPNENNVLEVSKDSERGNTCPPSPPLSPGSSVSTHFQDEYDNLLKNAVIVPTHNYSNVPNSVNQNQPLSIKESNCNTNFISNSQELKKSTYINEPSFGDYNKLYPKFHNNANDNDDDFNKMKRLLFGWTEDLNSKILNQFKIFKLEAEDECKLSVLNTKEKCAEDMHALHMQLENTKQMLENYNSLNEKKETIIKNLTCAVSESHIRLEKQKAFSEWRVRMVDAKREAFTSSLALQHSRRRTLQKAMMVWRSAIQSNWKSKVERACQARSQQVCLQLNREYEDKLQSLRESLVQSQREVEQLRMKRDDYESNVKKAIIRGVAALNNETMGVLQGNPDTLNQPAGRPTQSLSWSDDDLDLLCPDHLQMALDSINLQNKRQASITNCANLPQQSRFATSSKALKASNFKNGISKTTLNNNASLSNNVIIERHKPFDKGIASLNPEQIKCPICRSENQRQPSIVIKRQQGTHAPLSSLHTVRVVE